MHSRVARVLAFAPVAFALYVVSPWALYFSGWYEATLTSPLLHGLTHVHLLLVGSLFFWPLVGLDPVPGRLPYALRMLETFATLPFHAFLGVALMESTTLIAGDYYLGLGRSAASVADDQNLAGGLLWAAGDLVGAAVLRGAVRAVGTRVPARGRTGGQEARPAGGCRAAPGRQRPTARPGLPIASRP